MKKTLMFILLLLPLLGTAQVRENESTSPPPNRRQPREKVKTDSTGKITSNANFASIIVDKKQRVVFTQQGNNKLINKYMGRSWGLPIRQTSWATMPPLTPHWLVWPLKEQSQSERRKVPVSVI